MINRRKENGIAVGQLTMCRAPKVTVTRQSEAPCGDKCLALAGPAIYTTPASCSRNLSVFPMLRQMRQKKLSTPVLVLSAKPNVDNREKDLQGEGDDKLTKPFASSELLARLLALIRRATHAAEPTKLSAGDLALFTGILWGKPAPKAWIASDGKSQSEYQRPVPRKPGKAWRVQATSRAICTSSLESSRSRCNRSRK